MILPLSVFIRVLCLHKLIDTTLELQSTPGEQEVSYHIPFFTNRHCAWFSHECFTNYRFIYYHLILLV